MTKPTHRAARQPNSKLFSALEQTCCAECGRDCFFPVCAPAGVAAEAGWDRLPVVLWPTHADRRYGMTLCEDC